MDAAVRSATVLRFSGFDYLDYWQLPINGEARRDKNEKSLMLSYTILQLPLRRAGHYRMVADREHEPWLTLPHACAVLVPCKFEMFHKIIGGRRTLNFQSSLEWKMKHRNPDSWPID